MIRNDLDYLQDAQNVYEAVTSLQICITDHEGNQVIQQSTHPSIYSQIYNGTDLKDFYSKVIKRLPKINEPVINDAWPGIKMIVCPISVKYDTVFFIFAGCFLELENYTEESVQTYLKKKLKNIKKANKVFSLLQKFNPDEIKDKISKIKIMSNMLSDRLVANKVRANLEGMKKTYERNFQQLADGGLSIYDLLERLSHNNNSTIDFVGYASKKSPVEFEIKECVPSNNNLKGTLFFIGEGLLGYAAAIKTMKIWDSLEMDPRSMLFHRKGIFPKSILSIPIMQDEEIIGLLFIGSKASIFEDEIIPEVKFTAMSVKIIEQQKYWKDKANTYFINNKILSDIFQFTTTFQDKKAIQMFLLDMSINLTNKHFVSVLLINKLTNSLDIVSRGLIDEEISTYNTDLGNRIKNDDSKQLLKTELMEHTTEWNTKVLEIPIIFRNDLYGYLCIGLSEEIDEDELSLYKLLAKAGGVAVHMLKIDEKAVKLPDIMNVFVGIFEDTPPNNFKKVAKASKLIKEFGIYLSNPEINLTALRYCCFFINDDSQFLKKLEIEAIANIIEEYKSIVNNSVSKSEGSIDVQVLILVWTYVNEFENTDSLLEINGVSKELLNEFTNFLSQSKIKNSRISIYNDSYSVEDAVKKFGLTRREKDVLQLVLQGKTNKGIAEHLYISEHTVKNHMTNIFTKLGVNDRTQAVARIFEMGS